MPLFAKILTILNVLAAGAFIYLASLDYNARQQWSYEVFRHELVLNGLPVDETDVGLRVDLQPYKVKGTDTYRLPDDERDLNQRVDRPLYPDISDNLVNQMFDDLGAGDPVRTQKEEVERVRDKIKGELEGEKNEAKRRAAVKKYLLARARTARTVKERDESLRDYKDDKLPTAKLMDNFLARFDAAVAGGEIEDGAKRSVAERRAEVANLLYSLDPDLVSHQRLMVVVGLRAYTIEADAQAQTLRDMAVQSRLGAIDDRNEFESAYLLQRDRILALAADVLRRDIELKNVEAKVKSNEDEITKRKKEIEALKDEVKVASEKTEDSLKVQAKLEKDLFEVHKEIGDLIEANRKLERDIRTYELGRSRGGR